MPSQLIKDWFKITKVIQETPDTKTFRIGLGEPLDFLPGQFVMAGLELDVDGEKKMIKRAYSIASSPEKDYVEITFNLYPQGQFSPHLYKLKEGDSLFIEGPYGNFFFKEDIGRNIVFIGAGAGLTPLMCIIRHIIDRNLPIKFTLIYSVKKPENVIYKQELLDLERNKKLEFNLTITRPDGTEWTGRTGRINKEMIKELVKDLNGQNFYMCGPPEMIEGTVKILEELGVDKERINREQW